MKRVGEEKEGTVADGAGGIPTHGGRGVVDVDGQADITGPGDRLVAHLGRDVEAMVQGEEGGGEDGTRPWTSFDDQESRRVAKGGVETCTPT